MAGTDEKVRVFILQGEDTLTPEKQRAILRKTRYIEYLNKPISGMNVNKVHNNGWIYAIVGVGYFSYDALIWM